MNVNSEDITPELKAKAHACETPEELLELAQSEGYKLTVEEVDSIAGGWGEAHPCSASNYSPCSYTEFIG